MAVDFFFQTQFISLTHKILFSGLGEVGVGGSLRNLGRSVNSSINFLGTKRICSICKIL